MKDINIVHDKYYDDPFIVKNVKTGERIKAFKTLREAELFITGSLTMRDNGINDNKHY